MVKKTWLIEVPYFFCVSLSKKTYMIPQPNCKNLCQKQWIIKTKFDLSNHGNFSVLAWNLYQMRFFTNVHHSIQKTVLVYNQLFITTMNFLTKLCHY